jgi:hypothetical protein
MKIMKINEGQRERGGGGGEQLPPPTLVDGISIGNHMAKHRNDVAVLCRVQNVASACNAGGSSSLYTRMNAAAHLMQPLRSNAPQNQPPSPASTRQTHSARKHWHDKRSAQHSTRAAAAAPALSSRDPASHAPSPSQPSSTTCGPCAYGQAQWPVAGTRTTHRGA